MSHPRVFDARGVAHARRHVVGAAVGTPEWQPLRREADLVGASGAEAAQGASPGHGILALPDPEGLEDQAVGVHSREAHELSGAAVKQAEGRGVELWDLTDEEYSAISEHLTPEVRSVLSTEGSLNSRNSQGGTAPAAVERQLVALKAELDAARSYAG